METNIIVRNDGKQFSVNNYRFRVAKQSKFALEKEIASRFESGQIPSNNRYLIKSTPNAFAFVEGADGYDLAELIKVKVQSENFIYIDIYNCRLLVVICRESEIITDTYLNDEKLDDLTNSNLFSIDTEIDIFFTPNTEHIVDNLVEPHLVRSKTRLECSIIDQTSVPPSYLLRPWRGAIKFSGIYKNESIFKYSIAGVGLIVALLLLWPDKNKTDEDPIIAEQNRQLQDYKKLLHTVRADTLTEASISIIVEAESAAGWEIQELLMMQSGAVTIDFVDQWTMPGIASTKKLNQWADKYQYTLTWISSSKAKAVKALTITDSPLNPAPFLHVHRQLTDVFSGSGTITYKFGDPQSMGFYKKQEIIMAVRDEPIQAISEVMSSTAGIALPVVEMRWKKSGLFYNVTTKANIIGI